jgi:hypothetical protein
MDKMVKLEIFAPLEALPALQEALAEAGAGQIGNYDHCLSISRVQGTWRPLPGSNPYSGEIGYIQKAEELKLEVNCPVDLVPQVIQAIRRTHPYEEPVINVIPLFPYSREEEPEK